MKSKERLYDVIKSPIKTEKAHSIMDMNQYTFDVRVDATKVEIRQAVELIFGKKVTNVRTVYRPSKAKRVRYSVGRTQSGKKAIVTIEGGPIEELQAI